MGASSHPGWGPRFCSSGSEVSGIDLFITAIVAAWLVGFGAAAAGLAVRRRRKPATWALFGAVLGPAALAILQLAPPGRCWSCAAPTQGWLRLCPWCGEDVMEPAPEVAEPEEVHVRGQLTVIEGSAPRHPVERADAPAETGYAARRSATAPAEAESTARRDVDLGASQRRIEVPALPQLAELAMRVPTAAASAAVDAAADPVRRLKASLGRSVQSVATAQAVPAMERSEDRRGDVLASAIYVTGSRGLQAGSRYGIALFGDELRILGPVDINPGAVAIRHAIRGMDATGLQGRLIITAADGRRDQFALVFMSVAGGSAEGVADAIAMAAAEPRADSR